MVPLDKLSPEDSKYVLSLSGNEKFRSMYSVAHPKKAQEIDSSALIKASQTSGKSEFIHNGFDWCNWLIAANVDSKDAQVYAKKFVEQKMDKSALIDLEREVLRVLGVTEGDIIRIRRAVSQMPGVSTQQAQREKQAHEHNMKLLGTFRQNQSSSRASPDQNQPRSYRSKQEQERADEAFARKLQDEEIRNSSGNRGIL